MKVNLDLDRDIPVLDWESHLAERTKFMRSSAIRELLKITQDPEIISCAGGLPAPDVFPIREVDEACTYVVREIGKKALQYSATEGYRPLKEFLSDSMHKYGIPAKPEIVLLTNGSQKALDMIGRIFFDPGRFVLSGRRTYLGSIQAWLAYQARGEVGTDEVWMSPYPGLDRRWQVSKGGGQRPLFDPAGHRLFYWHTGRTRLEVVSFEGGMQELEITRRGPALPGRFAPWQADRLGGSVIDPANRGYDYDSGWELFLLLRPEFPVRPPGLGQVVVVVDWSRELDSVTALR